MLFSFFDFSLVALFICTSHSVTLSLGRVSMLEYHQACFEPNTCGFLWKCVNRPKCRLGLCQGHCLMQITLELILPFSPSKQFFKAFDNPQLYQSCPCLWDENIVCVQHIKCRIVIWGEQSAQERVRGCRCDDQQFSGWRATGAAAELSVSRTRLTAMKV